MYILSGTILTVLMWVLRIIEEYRDDAIIGNYCLKLFPPYLFGCSIIDVAFAKSFFNFEGLKGELNLYDFERNGQNLIYYAIDFFLYWILLISVENILTS